MLQLDISFFPCHLLFFHMLPRSSLANEENFIWIFGLSSSTVWNLKSFDDTIAGHIRKD